MSLKVIEFFGGIGACTQALKRIGVDFEVVDYVEIDKYAVKSYNAMNDTNYEPQDITKWDKDMEVDLIMHGSPCQDFSLAGKQAGGDKDSGTRSSLMYETIRIIEKLKPTYVVWENVKNLLSKKHRHNFDAYLETMEELGYTNYYQVLNAKDYGVPQNRERVFTISILNGSKFEFPKREELKILPVDLLEEDADEKYTLTDSNIKTYNRDFGSKGKQLNILEVAPTLTASMGTGGGNVPYFEFPDKEELKLRLKDVLEDEVDEKLYISNKTIDYICKTGTKKCEIKDGKQVLSDKPIKLGNTSPSGKSQCNDVFDTEGVYPSICARTHGNCNPSILVKEATKKGYAEATEGDAINLEQPNSKTRRGRVGHGVAQTLTTSCNQGVVVPPLRIRKLTPKECWRLMGFDDEVFEKAQAVNSNTQLYKQAGNSIVVNVLEKIFTNLLLDNKNL